MKKILAIDGGGIRGLIPALVLAEMESRTRQPIAGLFDLLAGTSTGGIIALGLIRDNGRGAPMYPASRLVELYEDKGPEIFPPSLFAGVKSLADEQYDSAPLLRILEDFFEGALMGQALKPVLIGSYDLERREPFFFKSWTDRDRQIDTRDVLMRSAAWATTAAPTYFRPALVRINTDEYPLIDGGVFVNNPAMSAYAESRRLFPQSDSCLLVSLGTGKRNQPIHHADAYGWGKLQWLRPILDVVFDGVCDAVDYQLQKILGEGMFFRFQRELQTANPDMDDASPENLEALKAEAQELINSQSANLDEVCRLLTEN